MSNVYKIVAAPEWRAAEAAGVFTGAAVDLADGYIHFSTAEQARETARLLADFSTGARARKSGGKA